VILRARHRHDRNSREKIGPILACSRGMPFALQISKRVFKAQATGVTS
jgi:hypothetical protein